MGASFCKPKLNTKNHNYTYDAIVIGGGSAGLAFAREAARNKASVALCDFVLPSPKGSTWGLGGTCVNAGCIPKRLFHQSNLVKDALDEADLFGWKSTDVEQVNWKSLVENVQEYISSLNFAYKITLSTQKITYFNGFAVFEDDHHLQIIFPDGKTESISGQCIIIATGGRPKYLGIPGGTAEDNLCITSDDIFSLSYPPGKTLCIGAGYISVECAGFLAGFGFDVTIMVRSTILKEFDVTAAALLSSNLEGRRVNILRNAEPTKITLVKDGSPPTLKVTYTIGPTKEVRVEEYNTVLLAIGRSPTTSTLKLELLPKIKVDPEGYIETDKYDCTGLPHIFALGDCAKRVPKLTPAAVRGGSWLAKRLYARGFKKTVNYENVPTAIFTPIEYGSCGLSEDQANAKYGSANVEIYHKSAIPPEFSLNKRDGEAVYAKLICHKSGNSERIVGFHYLGPNAGEITIGFSLPVRKKMLKEEIDNLIGIHPTCAEIFTDMTTSRRNLMKKQPSGCGG